jgi:hypothetical protein
MKTLMSVALMLATVTLVVAVGKKMQVRDLPIAVQKAVQ